MQILSSTAAHGSAKKLYPYQQYAIETLFEKMQTGTDQLRLLFQLPTGGGNTVIFSEIADCFVKQYKKKVIVLTHRRELCRQTSLAMKNAGFFNKVLDSKVKRIGDFAKSVQ